jgi:Beta-lactamase enzyme family
MTFFQKESQLQSLGDQILEDIWKAYPKLAKNQLALTWIVYDQPFVNTGGALSPMEFWSRKPQGFSYRGVECIYPASVVKLFYLVAAHEWLEQNMIQSSTELDRAMTDMIVDSSNDGTGLVVDTLTGTTSGPELADGPFETWKHQRNLVNRYFQSLQWEEFNTINVCQKTWGDGPYGRERVFYGAMLENRNSLTTDATARMLHAIVGGVAVSAKRSQAMMKTLARSIEPKDLEADPENQVTEFLGAALPPLSLLWSKAGWMSQARHDTAYIETPDTMPYALTVFSEGRDNSQDKTLLPFISQSVYQAMRWSFPKHK